MAPYSLALEHTPSILKEIFSLRLDMNVTAPTGPDRFSPLEVVAHLADWEVIFRGRIELALAQPGATATLYDEGERAAELNYAAADLHDELSKFTEERGKTVQLLRSLTPEQWKSTFQHPEKGTLTVQDQVTMLLGHDLYHVEQLLGG